MPDTSDNTLASRRTLLAGAGAAGLAATGIATGLAGCGTSSGSGSSGMGGGTGGTESAPPMNPPASEGDAGAGGGAATTGINLGAKSHIPVGGGKIFKTEKVVVTQPTSGHFKAFTAVCTHQGCVVNKVTGGLIKCPCHGSQFSVKDGSVKGGPAPAPLAEKTVTVKNGNIIVT
ncbi:MAG TPA: Rieske (2Fe-2S) protein [Rugosimonospora sp.]|nr:Rieske (2Fe-2S) protein [Rugosimonospora sp.]